MLVKGIDVFENYLQSVDELYDERSIVIAEADILIETDRKA